MRWNLSVHDDYVRVSLAAGSPDLSAVNASGLDIGRYASFHAVPYEILLAAAKRQGYLDTWNLQNNPRRANDD